MFGNRGFKTISKVYKRGTIFYNAAESSNISVHNQVSFTAEETVISKLKFENEAMGAGVPVESYSTDNGISNSKEFTRYLHVKGQGIRHSEVGGCHHNGISYNAIKNVVRIDITMMVHSALRCPDAREKILWIMYMAHYIHLHNNNPHRMFIPRESQDIKELEQYGTYNIFYRKSVTGSHILTST